MPQAVAVPLGAAAIGAAGSIYSAKKMSGSSPQTSAAQSGITDLARMLQGQSQGVYNVGLPAYQRATGFYNSLLGNRTAQTQALAPALENNAASAQGMQNSIRAQSPRGPAQDLALAQAKMQQHGQNANMYRDAPFNAAAGLGQLGIQGLSQANSAGANSMQGYSTLFGNQMQMDMYRNAQSAGLGQSLGGLLTQLLPLMAGGSKTSSGGGKTYKVPPSGTPRGGAPK